MTILERLSTDLAPPRRAEPQFDSGIIIFCGIGLLLSLAAMLFGWLGMVGAVGF